MRKNILYFTTIALIMLLGACSNDALLIENDNKETMPETSVETGRKITLSATMPVPTTRVNLVQQEDLSVKLTWQTGDELQFAFVQGDKKIKKTYTLTADDISAGDVNAQFAIDVPVEIADGTFDLYGVYGGGGLSDADPTKVKLPTNASSAYLLDEIRKRKDVMLHFASKNMETNNPSASVIFKHLGSLFNVTIKNTNTTLFGNRDLKQVREPRLVGVDEGNWAFNVGEGGGSYDLVNGEFLNSWTAGNYFSFPTSYTTHLTSGNQLSFWAWYPPLPDVDFPELKLELRYPADQGNPLIATSANTILPSNNAAGNVYYVFATWNGLDLEFTDEEFTPPTVMPTELSTDNWARYLPGDELLPGDTRENLPSRSLPQMWDDNTTTSFFETSDALGDDVVWPISFSIDLGENQNKKLTHARFFHRTNNHTVRWGSLTPNKWEVFGSNNPNVDGSWDSWTKIADCVSLKPSGLVGERGYVDNDIVAQPEVYKITGTPTAYRYIRFKVYNTWNERGGNRFRFFKMELYGIGESSSLTLDVSLPPVN